MLRDVFTEVYSWKSHLNPRSSADLEGRRCNKYARVCGDVTLRLIFSFIYIHKVKEQKHLFSRMAKWFYITWRVIACDIRGQGNCDTQAWVGLVAVVLKFPPWSFRDRGWSPSSGWHNHRVRHEVKQLGIELLGKEKCAFTAITPASLPSAHPHHTAALSCSQGQGQGGWIDSLPFCPSAKSHLQAHYSEWCELWFKMSPEISKGNPG